MSIPYFMYLSISKWAFRLFVLFGWWIMLLWIFMYKFLVGHIFLFLLDIVMVRKFFKIYIYAIEYWQIISAYTYGYKVMLWYMIWNDWIEVTNISITSNTYSSCLTETLHLWPLPPYPSVSGNQHFALCLHVFNCFRFHI